MYIYVINFKACLHCINFVPRIKTDYQEEVEALKRTQNLQKVRLSVIKFSITVSSVDSITCITMLERFSKATANIKDFLHNKDHIFSKNVNVHWVPANNIIGAA